MGPIDNVKVIFMNWLAVSIVVFMILESLNILTLYFAPSSKKGNGIGIFNAYELSKTQPEVHALVRYLINWVAGTKLIFVALLLVILLTGSQDTRLYAVLALIASIASFYWRLYPAIKTMDRQGLISPKGYSNTLGWLIAIFIGVFVVALALFAFAPK
jgi:hypothetical protein